MLSIPGPCTDVCMGSMAWVAQRHGFGLPCLAGLDFTSLALDPGRLGPARMTTACRGRQFYRHTG